MPLWLSRPKACSPQIQRHAPSCPTKSGCPQLAKISDQASTALYGILDPRTGRTLLCHSHVRVCRTRYICLQPMLEKQDTVPGRTWYLPNSHVCLMRMHDRLLLVHFSSRSHCKPALSPAGARDITIQHSVEVVSGDIQRPFKGFID